MIFLVMTEDHEYIPACEIRNLRIFAAKRFHPFDDENGSNVKKYFYYKILAWYNGKEYTLSSTTDIHEAQELAIEWNEYLSNLQDSLAN